MKLKPHNKYICIKPISQPEEEEQTNKFYIPNDMVAYQHYIYEVLNKSDDCTLKLNVGDKVIVLQNMVEQVKFNDQTLHVCPENGIVATIL
jgi:co-chaperonin GroES (HSP10)